jgi:YD repeat-containing protein
MLSFLRRFAIVNLFVSISVVSFCQEPNGGLKSVVPVSPNAATLGKFGEVPVNLYNGSASITVPLYELKTANLKVPVTLEYHTGGIKLKERAGWVGLGWALNAGGVISRSIMGNDDLYSFDPNRDELVTKGQMSDPMKRLSTNGQYSSQWFLYSTKNETFDYRSFAFNVLDVEYDVFNYNFLGKSGKFIITRTGQVVFEKECDLKVEYYVENNWHRFKITDEAGNIHYFKDAEFTNVTDRPITQITSWYLTKIESPVGDHIDFEYDPAASPSLHYEIASDQLACSGLHGESVVSIGVSYTNVLVLKKITADDISVEFPMDAAREDYNSKKITGVKVNFGSQLQKQFDFSYSYFNANVPPVTGKEFKRLKLDKVTEIANGKALQPYSFKYNEPTPYAAGMTNVESYAFDHWGYFNGVSNTSLLPAFSGQVWDAVISHYMDIPGANKDPDPQYMKVFSLSEVQYPTGGKTLLTSECNTFDPTYLSEFGQISAPTLQVVDKSQLVLSSQKGTSSGSFAVNSPMDKVTVQIGFIFNTPDSYATLRNTYDKVYVIVNGARYDISSSQLTLTSNVSWSAEFQIPATTISWSTYIDNSVGPEFNMITVNAKWKQVLTSVDATHKYLNAGGLRIAKVQNYDSDSKLLLTKVYDYHYTKPNDPATYSNGKLLSQPMFYRTVALGSCWSFSRSSISVLQFSQSIGYNTVTEYSIDESSLKGMGKTIYSFSNKVDSALDYNMPVVVNPNFDLGEGPIQFPNLKPYGMTNLSYATNGLQTSREDYLIDATGDHLIKKVNNYYEQRILNNYFSLRLELEASSQPAWIYYVFPAIRSQRILPSKTITRTYDASDTLKSFVTDETLVYSRNHTLPIKQVTVGSTGAIEEQNMIYPLDYEYILSGIPAWLTNLKNKHVISSPVETYTTTQPPGLSTKTVISGTLTTFKSSLPLPDSTYQLESVPMAGNLYMQSNINGTSAYKKPNGYKSKILYYAYDNKGNILSMSKDSDVRVSYVWGYNQTMPIAEVKNATETQIAHFNFEDNTTNVTSPGRTGAKCYNAAYTVNIPFAGTYKLTYWKKVGAGAWQTVETTISANTSIGAAGTLIDDVRVYPASAQMTTYTYDVEGKMTSSTDANNISAFFQYDDFGRLSLVLDNDGNIVKQYNYNYQLR